MRRAGLLAAAIAVALMAWIWTDRPGRALRANRAQPAAPPVAEPDDAAAPEPEPLDAPGLFAVRGRVVLIGSDRVPGRVTGTFVPARNGDRAVTFDARDGRFEVEMLPGRYWSADVKVDGELIGNFQQEVVVDRQGEVELRIPDACEVTLVVVDARDWRPLRDVLVYENRDENWTVELKTGSPLPGPKTMAQEPRRTDALGRLVLGRGRGSAALYLYAEGCAWRAAAVPFGAGDEVVVGLEPGGDARLVIPRFAQLRAPQIWANRLRTDDWIGLVPAAWTDEVLVRGLAADDYEFTVRRGTWFEDGRVYGAVTAAIRAGETTTITIPVTPDPVVMVKVTGTVTVPEGWDEEPSRISFEGAEESNAEIREGVELRDCGRPADADGPRSPLCFSTAEIPAGRYLVDIEPCLWAKEILVTERTSHFDFDLPAPLRVRVRVATEGQEALPGAHVTWYMPATEGSRMGWSVILSRRAGDASVFQAPPGGVVIQAGAPGFLGSERRLNLREDCDVTILLERAATVYVRLRIDGSPFDGAGVAVQVRGGDTTWTSGFFGGVARFDQLQPGMVSASIDDVIGCEPAAPIEVEVGAGQARDVWFDLKRKIR